MVSGISLRTASANDADAIGRAHVACWHETYTGLVPVDLLENMSIDDRSAMWTDILAEPHRFDDTLVLLAEQAGALVGFGACGLQPLPAFRQDGFGGEITALYVRKTAQRCGVGGTLMRAMARDLRQRALHGATLWVLRDNLPARRFYEELGGTKLGERTDRRTFGDLPEIAYGWRNLDHVANLAIG